MQQSLKRVGCLAQFELTRLCLTKSGVLSLLAFATAWLIILYYPVNYAVEWVYSDSLKDIARDIFGAFGISELLNWPVPEIAMYWLIALFLYPIFAIIISSDQTCADRARGTLRFITLRASRTEIIYGRFLGQVVILTGLIALTLIASVIIAVMRDSSLISVSISLSFFVFFELVIVILPFIALMSFFNSFSNSSRKSIIYVGLFYGLVPLIFALLESYVGQLSYLYYIFPGIQLSNIINPSDTQLSAHLLPLIQMLVLLFLSQYLMKRTSI